MDRNKLSFTLANGSRVLSLPGSAETIRGFSAPSLIIEDEAAFVDDGLYRSVRLMLAISGGRLILMSTPYGKRGHFYEAWRDDAEPWERIAVTAADCPRIAPGFLAAERAAIGEWWFRQEYGCAHGEALLRELQAFRVTVGQGGGTSYAGRGAHDDLVIAAALALWRPGTAR